MRMTADAAAQMIADFGETVTVKPQAPQGPTDSNNPVYFEEGTSNESNFDEEVRVYTSPSEEMLNDFGFEESTEAIIYNDQNNIDEGDIVEILGNDFVVKKMQTNQMGNGAYIFIYGLIGN